jgi:hypothetical protein
MCTSDRRMIAHKSNRANGLRQTIPLSLQEPYIAERLLDMIWHITMPPNADAAPELLQSNVMSEVLRQYEEQGCSHSVLSQQYLYRCVEQLSLKQVCAWSEDLVRCLYPWSCDAHKHSQGALLRALS